MDLHYSKNAKKITRYTKSNLLHVFYLILYTCFDIPVLVSRMPLYFYIIPCLRNLSFLNRTVKKIARNSQSIVIAIQTPITPSSN